MKVVCLISGGIDSAVALAVVLEHKVEVIALHMQISLQDSTEKVKKILLQLSKYFSKRFKSAVKIKLIVVPFYEVHTQIGANTNRKFACIICKRTMLRIAEKLANEENAEAIVMGDSLGQVASQTLYNLHTISRVCKLPIARPLLTLDKIEIEKLARKYNTYEYSILAAASCTLIPKKPATQSRGSVIENEERKICINSLIEKIVQERKIFEIGYN